MHPAFLNEYNLKTLKKIQLSKFKMYVTPRYVEHFSSRDYEPFSSKLVSNYIHPESTFVDIGAHYGYYSLLAAKSSNKIKIIAIEPVKENFEILKKNIISNKVEDYEIINAAVSEKEEKRQFNITEASDSAGFYNHPLTHTTEKVTVKTVFGDKLLAKEKVGMIKIDVEGHEIPVIRGLKKTIVRDKPILLVEYNPKLQKLAGYTGADLINLLYMFGYDVYCVDDTQGYTYRLTDNIYSLDDLVGDQSYVNLWAVPDNLSMSTMQFSHSSRLEGAERSLIDLAIKLQGRGVIPTIVFPHDGPAIKLIRESAISKIIVPTSWWASGGEKVTIDNITESMRILLENIDILAKINPHIIINHTSVIPWGAVTADLLKKPLLWYIHEFGDLDHHLEYYSSFTNVKKTIGESADKVVFNSKAVCKSYARYVSRSKQVVNYYNINIADQLLAESIPEVYDKSRDLRLMVLGTIRKSKGQDQAIQAVKILKDRGISVQLVILGKYDKKDIFYQRLKKNIKENKLEGKIRILNFVNNPYPYIKQAHVMLMCSEAEAFGRVTVEAMLLGKPVIVSKGGANTEIITNEKSGFIYEWDDSSDLADKIEIFVNKPKMIRIMGERAQIEANTKFGGDRYIKEIMKLCKVLADKSKRSGDPILPRMHLSGLALINSDKIRLKEALGQISDQEKLIKEYRDNYNACNEQLDKIHSSKFYKTWRGYHKLIDRNLVNE